MKLFIALGLLVAGVLAKQIENNPRVTDKCAAEIANYSECFKGVKAEDLDTKEDIENFCSNFSLPKCKKFLEDVSKTTSSCFSENNVNEYDALELLTVLEYRIEYLLMCSRKSDDDSLCPVSKLYMDNAQNLMYEEQEKITDEQLKAITEDCNIDECNQRMNTFFDEYNLAIKIMSNFDDNIYVNDNEPYFHSQLLYGYQTFYGNKMCSTTDIVKDPYENINEDCRAELSQYTDCINELDEMSIDSESELQQFCSTFQKPTCKKLLEDINKTDSACTLKPNMISENINDTEKVMELKLNYLLFCPTDNNGNQCPVTKYSNTIFDKLYEEQSEITPEQNEIISEDCKIEECNDRMVTLFNIYDKYLYMESYLYDFSMDYEYNPNFIDQFLYSYQDFYKNKNCDPNDIIHYEPINYCEKEIQLYQECIDEVKDIKLNNEKDINTYCNKIDTSAKCINFLYDLQNTYLSCFPENNPNMDDFQAGIDYFENKLNYHLLCSKDKNGKRCPVSEYIVTNYDEASKDYEEEVILTEKQLSVIKDDCANNRCNEQRETLFTIYNNYKMVFEKLMGEEMNFSSKNFGINFLNNYVTYYGNRECVPSVSELLNGTRSTECEEEYAKYSKCMNDLKLIDFDTVNSIDYLCYYMETYYCKNFMKDLTVADSTCINVSRDQTKDSTTQNNIDFITGLTILGLRLQYQTYCGTDTYGNICPLSMYIMNTYGNVYYGDEDGDGIIDDTKYSGINELKFGEELKIIGDDCRDDKCNARILSIQEIAKYVNSTGIKTNSPLANDETILSYITNFKEKTCNDIYPEEDRYDNNPIDIGFNMNAPSPECQEEYLQYAECLSQLEGLSQDNIDNLNTMCTLLSNSQCDSFINNLSKPNSICIDNMDPTNMNFMDYLYGIAILSYKMQYLLYCVKDTKENTCPLSQYLLEISAKENTNENEEEEEEYFKIKKSLELDAEVTPEQLKVIASDCRDHSCNSRMMTIKEYYKYLESIMSGMGGGGQMSDDSNLIMYIDYYVDGNCSAIDNSDPSLDSDIINYKKNSKSSDDSNTPVTTINDDNKNDENKSSSNASTLMKMTFTTIMMVMLSSFFLL